MGQLEHQYLPSNTTAERLNVESEWGWKVVGTVKNRILLTRDAEGKARAKRKDQEVFSEFCRTEG